MSSGMFDDCGYTIDSQIVVFLPSHIAETRLHCACLIVPVFTDQACKISAKEEYFHIVINVSLEYFAQNGEMIPTKYFGS